MTPADHYRAAVARRAHPDTAPLDTFLRISRRVCVHKGCDRTVRPGSRFCSAACRDRDRSRVGMLTAALERARTREERRRRFGIVDTRPVRVRLDERAQWGRWERERCLWVEAADGYTVWPERDVAALLPAHSAQRAGRAA